MLLVCKSLNTLPASCPQSTLIVFTVTFYCVNYLEVFVRRFHQYTGCSKKTVPLFYLCDNFRKCAPILTIFSLVEQEIYHT